MRTGHLDQEAALHLLRVHQPTVAAVVVGAILLLRQLPMAAVVAGVVPISSN